MTDSRELVKKFIEENKAPVMGSITVSPPVVAAILTEMKHATEALAKANERVAELERKEGRFDQYALESEVMREALLNKDRNADDVSPRDLKDGLNKFAIENQIKSLEGALNSYVTAKFYPTTYAIQAFNDGVTHLYAHIQEKIEQLRKGQDGEQ